MDIILVHLNQQQLELPWVPVVVMVWQIQVFYLIHFLLALQLQLNLPNWDISPQFPPKLPPPSPHFICLSNSLQCPQQFCHILTLSCPWVNLGLLLSRFISPKHVCVHHGLVQIISIRLPLPRCSPIVPLLPLPSPPHLLALHHPHPNQSKNIKNL